MAEAVQKGDSLEPEVSAKLPEILQMPFADAIAALHMLERKTRLARDDIQNDRVCREIGKLCVDAKRWLDLGTNTTLISGRRGASRRAVTTLMEIGMDALGVISDANIKVNLAKTLSNVAEGKIFLEVQRARVVSVLVDRCEAEGDKRGALDLLHELRLKVLTQMDENERVRMQLRQFRLCLELEDHHRAALCCDINVGSDKVDKELKMDFLSLSARYHADFTKDYYKLASLEEKLFEATDDAAHLSLAIVALFLAARSDERVALCQQIAQRRALARIPLARNLLQLYTGRRVVIWRDFENEFGSLVQGYEELARRRLIEHNLRLLSEFYSAVHSPRLAEVLDITEAELEERIIELVFNESFGARIDRPSRVVRFVHPKTTEAIADEFSAGVAQLCRLVDEAHILVERAKMQQSLMAK